MLKDGFGVYETTFTYVEPDNGKTYEFRKYVNSKRIKEFGGMYSLYCQEDNCIVFRRSEYLRDKSYKRFSEGKCFDAVDCEPYDMLDNMVSQHVESSIKKKSRYYSLPSKIDTSKLTNEEFQELRRLIKKGLVTE